MSVTAVVGRVGLGFVIDRLNMRRASALSMASQAVALLLIGLFDDRLVLLSACALFGLSVGGSDYASGTHRSGIRRESFALIVGLSTAIGQVTYAFGRRADRPAARHIRQLLRADISLYALLTVAAVVVSIPQRGPVICGNDTVI